MLLRTLRLLLPGGSRFCPRPRCLKDTRHRRKNKRESPLLMWDTSGIPVQDNPKNRIFKIHWISRTYTLHVLFCVMQHAGRSSKVGVWNKIDIPPFSRTCSPLLSFQGRQSRRWVSVVLVSHWADTVLKPVTEYHRNGDTFVTLESH